MYIYTHTHTPTITPHTHTRARAHTHTHIYIRIYIYIHADTYIYAGCLYLIRQYIDICREIFEICVFGYIIMRGRLSDNYRAGHKKSQPQQ